MSKVQSKIKLKTKDYRTCLSRQGYSLVKSKFSDQELLELKKELTVKPFINSQYNEQPKIFPVYVENDTKIYLPRYFGFQKYGLPDKDKLDNGLSINLKFSGSLRSKQIPIVTAYLKATEDSGGGIISVGCGEGKTVIALNIISRLKRKTLVVVHKDFLLNQWKERILGDPIKNISGFLPNARVGIIKGSRIDIKDKDIVIGMLQSISMKNYPSKIFSEFGLVIYDECHHVSAEVFSRALLKTGFRYTLGLSATPKRKDGLTKVFKWYLGEMAYQAINTRLDVVNINIYSYYNDNSDYFKEIKNYMGRINSASMITKICDSPKRNNFILSLIKKLIKENRKILVLSDRKKQLTYLNNTIQEDTSGPNGTPFATSGLYVGGMKNSDLKESEQANIMLGTFAMVSEGFDNPELNTLILASSKSDIVQSVGRILRKKPEDRILTPTIIDIWDRFSIFERQGYVRAKYYKKKKYNLINFKVDHNGNNPIITKLENKKNKNKNNENNRNNRKSRNKNSIDANNYNF